MLKVHGEQLPLRALKAAGAEGNLEAVAEYSRTLTEQKEQLVEVGAGAGRLGDFSFFFIVIALGRKMCLVNVGCFHKPACSHLSTCRGKIAAEKRSRSSETICCVGVKRSERSEKRWTEKKNVTHVFVS